MLIWWTIHFGLYYTLKTIIRRSSERQKVEMFTTPLIAFYNHRRWKLTESYGFWGGLVATLILAFFARRFFENLQESLVFGDGLYISDSYFILPIAFLAVNLFIIFYLLGAKSSFSKDKNWVKQPTIFQIEERIARYQVRFLYCSILCQMVFVMAMFNYIRLDENGVQHNSFYNLTEKTIIYQDIKKITIWVDEWNVNRDGKRAKEFHPYFTIDLKDNKKLELWDNIHFSKKDYDLLKKALKHFHENDVLIDITQPGIYEKSKLRKHFHENVFNKIMDFFEYGQAVLENRVEPIAIKTPIEIEKIKYQVDSSLTDYGQGFNSPTKGKRFERVFMTIENNSKDTCIIVEFHLNVVDAQDNKYGTCLWAKDTFNTYIPPYTTHSGNFVFQVPDTTTDLKLSYEDGFLNKRVIWFDLTKNTPNSRLIPSTEQDE